MTGRSRASLHKTKHVEIRVMLPAEAHKDLVQMAKVSGLAASQYMRTLFMTHRAKIYDVTEKDEK